MFVPIAVKNVFSINKIITVLIFLLVFFLYKSFNNVSDIDIKGFDDILLQTKIDNDKYKLGSEYTNVYYKNESENGHGVNIKVITHGHEDLIDNIVLLFTFDNSDACYSSFNKMVSKYYEKHDLINYLWFDSFSDKNKRTIDIIDSCAKRLLTDNQLQFKVYISSVVENKEYTILYEKQKNEKLINGLKL
jgi:hypothetical protein